MNIRTILLLPHADARERLLAPGAPVWDSMMGRFGWTVDDRHVCMPTADGDLSAEWDVDDCVHLVLARDGAVVPEGADRLARIRSFGRDETEAAFRDALKGYPGSITAIRRWFGVLGTLVLLDADGKDVSP